MKKRFVAAFILVGSLVFGASVVSATTTYKYDDNWVNWPGYHSSLDDENGTPKIDYMNVIINDDTNHLSKIEIVLHDSTHRQAFDSLFISTGGDWDSWNYFVHDGGDRNDVSIGNVPVNGLYSVNNPDNYTYTYATTNRKDNPNGINNSSLTSVNSAFEVSQTGYVITYDFASIDIDMNLDSFFVAYAPWCANDVMGGGTAPVPEPATMVLFGTGLFGLVGAVRRRNKKS